MSESNAVRIGSGGSAGSAGSRGSARRPTRRRRTTTKWGDREQRRIDILDAARARIADGGYVALNMRDLAADAGISPGTLYSYFATKEELFATLYIEAIRRHTDALRSVVETSEHDLVALLTTVIERHLDLYRAYGRYLTLWSAMRHDDDEHDARVRPELVAELRSVTIEQSRLLMGSLRDAARRDGRELVDEKLVAVFLWSALNGIADHFTSERRSLDPFPARKLISFSARRLAVAITDA